LEIAKASLQAGCPSWCTYHWRRER